MAPISDAKKKANAKWDKANLDKILIVTRKGNKQIIKECAALKGESVNAYIIKAINDRIESENNKHLI